MRSKFVIGSIVGLVSILLAATQWRSALLLLIVALPAVAVGVYDMVQHEHSLRRNFPLVSRGRWLLESLRPYVRQYLFESETDGRPVSRMFRSLVYQRAKGAQDTVPFGTKMDTYQEGYEWIAHSLAAIAIAHDQQAPRVPIGGPDCRKPYSASLLNTSAMSFGSLSPNAIRALNAGARRGGYAHNTGEGGISPYHLEHGGDLIWQVGTGYFGCRGKDGRFDRAAFADAAGLEAVKMIELKLSQGAKPGHGGILPASKNTPEIAAIRGVKVYTEVISPPAHTAFSTPVGMMEFIQQLRDSSGGKPVGFKLCVGRESEVIALCKAMLETGITPDFITVDGGEGGTGAAPLEFTNSIGMPLRDGLAFLCNVLSGFDLKKSIRVIAVGRIFTGFDIVRHIALGADACYSARGFMLSIGCVQSLLCNTNHCPTGVATQLESLSKGLVVSDKSERAARYQQETVKHAIEILAAAGLRSPAELNRTHIYRRISHSEIRRYDELYAYTDVGSLLHEPYPPHFQQQMIEADAHCFKPKACVAQHGGGFRKIDMLASA